MSGPRMGPQPIVLMTRNEDKTRHSGGCSTSNISGVSRHGANSTIPLTIGTCKRVSKPCRILVKPLQRTRGQPFLGFVGHTVCVAMTQLSLRGKAAMDDRSAREHGYIPVKLYGQILKIESHVNCHLPQKCLQPFENVNNYF